ncbi:MAG TPA: hypothetical protein VFS12_11830 [Terriglobia bacterium]|nr:hypothetical protein [Terriglobia bacterium]
MDKAWKHDKLSLICLGALSFLVMLLLVLQPMGTDHDARVLDIRSRLEMFVDRYLVDRLQGAQLRLNHPVDAGIAIQFDRPWEGAFSGYVTVIKDGPIYRMYYRCLPIAGKDGNENEATCYAESRDGIQWTKPDLGIYEMMGTRRNNVVLAQSAPFTHNFSPMLDTRPGVPPAERFKGLGGTKNSGLVAFVSADGLRWRQLREQAVITQGYFDSQNVAFWSETEKQYVCYFRTFKPIEGKGVRWITRATSKDFLSWSEPVDMSFGEAPPEHLYTNQTHPYFRAPHLYIGIAARFMPGRQVLSDEQARAINVDPGYFKDCSDNVLLTSRGGNHYDRTFMEAFVRPGIGPENWTSRTNYPALNVVPTGPSEMSLFVQHRYGQPAHHLRRYTLRTDGFASVNAPYQGGELITKPVRFTGTNLVINFATSAPGGLHFEIQDKDRKPIPGYALEDSLEVIGNEIERQVAWKDGSDVGRLAGQTVRLRVVMKDADLYAFRFR